MTLSAFLRPGNDLEKNKSLKTRFFFAQALLNAPSQA